MARNRYDDYDDYDFGYPQYIPVAQRKLDAQKKIKSLNAKGEELSPVVIEGRAIAKTFWGKAWCDNIESYHDYENRLPRGRSYVRSGAVIDLKITKGKITALVMGSELYKINITIQELAKDKWAKIKRDCTGKISSLINLINGKLSPEIIELLCRQKVGIFPEPKEIKMTCNCPDWADLCKHLAAVLYGVGARLDKQPELFFLLRNVDQNELLSADIAETLVDNNAPDALVSSELDNIFGIELDSLEVEPVSLPKAEKKKPARAKKTAPPISTATPVKPKKRKLKRKKTISPIAEQVATAVKPKSARRRKNESAETVPVKKSTKKPTKVSKAKTSSKKS
ncbi:MAG: SWIM zinc finger family protein [Victivallaceae bacterium]|jgi:uncharacterized Zn finger protein|nr:SWIM zinc finger family protein [Victivallaceae bacterium]MDD3704210.1 SWIM zinc finger family protein [Victivallaceae bacterium]